MKNKPSNSDFLNGLLAGIDMEALDGEALLDDEITCPNEDMAALLRERYLSLRQRTAFKPGDMVTWKVGLKNRRLPRVGQPAVVVQVLDTPAMDTSQDAGSQYFGEPLDLILGIIVDEEELRGEFLTWHFDSRRFTHWKK